MFRSISTPKMVKYWYQVEELNTMENEHGINPAVLLDSEIKASTSKDLLCDQNHSEDESESFSDIDDEEQQVAKEAAVEAAQKEVYEAILNNCLEDLLEARKRYESALAALQKFRKNLFLSVFLSVFSRIAASEVGSHSCLVRSLKNLPNVTTTVVFSYFVSSSVGDDTNFR
ncbi:hypothetical protein TSUD_328100 [Trifolium subterraneum]|uniref:Uncharacterized protein n=1 Tax=Trifolium subterraneum TaxID=3900 RepID=A0A2Z6M066_TRISU|nr:hypothetical protein TSUD_328100 [Trifolium subterraneum]